MKKDAIRVVKHRISLFAHDINFLLNNDFEECFEEEVKRWAKEVEEILWLIDEVKKDE